MLATYVHGNQYLSGLRICVRLVWSHKPVLQYSGDWDRKVTTSKLVWLHHEILPQRGKRGWCCGSNWGMQDLPGRHTISSLVTNPTMLAWWWSRGRGLDAEFILGVIWYTRPSWLYQIVSKHCLSLRRVLEQGIVVLSCEGPDGLLPCGSHKHFWVLIKLFNRGTQVTKFFSRTSVLHAGVYPKIS